jgi:hypothetical protein
MSAIAKSPKLTIGVSIYKRGKSDVNVARATLTWQLRHTSSQTWQERRSSGKRGKSDVPVEQERRSSGKHGKRDVPVENVARETF